MKKLITLILVLATFTCTTVEAQRYLTETFTEVTIERDIQYARNYTVLTVSDPMIGRPTSQNLLLNLYTPTGDTETDRPLVILFHTGNFLPQGLNGGVFGTVDDEPVVEVATRLAKLGYVVAVADYRQGWNPISPSQDTRINTLINASYRGIQDARSCVRFFRKDAIDGGNQYGICPERVTYWGIGTGGYISSAAAAIDSYEELAILPKFIDSLLVPMVIPSIHGDPFGTSYGFIPGAPAGFDTLSLPNHVGYDHEVQLTVNMGGAIGDTSWMDAGDPAYICYHVPDDPFAPYLEDILIVPTTGDLIVEVQGSYLMAKKANELGLNNTMRYTDFNDEFSASANAKNDGYEGLFPLLRPTWTNPLNPTGPELSEASPWDWWNDAFWSTQPHPSCGGVAPPTCSFDFIARLNNPDASETKGKTYIDSIMGYFAPRAYAQLNLWSPACATVNTDEVLTDADVSLMVSPNPSDADMLFTSNEENPMQSIELFDLSGRRIKTVTVNNTNYTLTRDYFQTGMYIAKVRFEKGVVAQKVIFK